MIGTAPIGTAPIGTAPIDTAPQTVFVLTHHVGSGNPTAVVDVRCRPVGSR